MSVEINIDKIKGFSAIAVLYTICSLTSGFLFLYFYKKDLFLSLDLYRLTLIAISIISPILIINTTMTFIRLQGDKMEVNEQNDKFHKAFISAIYLGSMLTTFVVYLSILLGYCRDKRDLKEGVLILVTGEIFTIIIYPIVVKLLKKKK